jgi:DNA-directed RNA polymerase subunit M/transcription elongation factor TFIIS
MSNVKFCEKCEKILMLKIGKNKDIVNFCELCKGSYKIEGHILKHKKKTSINRYKDIAEAALYDDTMPRIRKKCKHCSNDILVYFKDIDTMRNVYVCRLCKKSWINKAN